jgi:hypothetical protein
VDLARRWEATQQAQVAGRSILLHLLRVVSASSRKQPLCSVQDPANCSVSWHGGRRDHEEAEEVLGWQPPAPAAQAQRGARQTETSKDVDFGAAKAAVLEAPSEERPKKHKKRKRASSEAQDAVKQPASKAAEATSFNEAIPVLDQESAEVPPGLGTPKKKKKRKREAAIEEPSPAQLPEPTSLSLPDEIQDDASVKKKRKKPKHRPDAVESDIVQHTWSASAIMPAPATLSLPTSHNQTEPASSALLGVNEDGLRVKKKRKKSKLSSNAGPTEQACQTVQPSVALLMPAAPALHQESREALAELEKPKKKKRTREATSNESLPKEDSEAASNPPPDNAQDDTPVKKRKKSKPRSHASQTEQPRQTAGASAALPGPAAPPLPAAPPKKAQKATLPVQPSKPPVKRLTRPPCSPSFLDELEAIAAAPKDPSAVSGRPVDIGDFFKFELQPPRVKKKPANTAHKVKNPALLPAAAPVNEDSFATARRELLLHGRSSTADTAKKAQLLGFVLQRGNFSLAEDETIKETIATISASRGITEAEFITMVRNVPRGPLRNDEAGHAVKEWRSLVVAKLDRPAKSVANRVRIMFDETGRLGSLTTEEHLRLLDLVAEHGRQWQLIGGLMGRSAIYLRQAWIRRTETPNKSTGRWAQDEVS